MSNFVLTLSPEDRAFLQIEHLSMVAASRSSKNIPFLARAVGRRFGPDLRQITLFFSSADAQDMLERIAGSGMIAAVFSLPSTHQTLQLKGSDARIDKVLKNDVQLVASYRRAVVDQLEELGFARPLIDTMLACEPGDLSAVTFTPSAAFSQTPGPNAGRAIGGSK